MNHAASCVAVPAWKIGFAADTAHWSAEAEAPVALNLALPWLAGARMEQLADDFQPLPQSPGSFRLFARPGGWLAGAGIARVGFPLEESTYGLYREAFALAGERRLVRIWNVVPAINASTHGLENYRAFCVGRARAFDDQFGTAATRAMPAASAVGTDDTQLVVVFVAAPPLPRHVENPEQVPAWNYPAEHGPRPPAFARATSVTVGRETWHFVSGTSAIKGHHTVGAGDLAAQLRCTLDNLRLVSRELGLGDDFAAPAVRRRWYRIYLRRASDLAWVNRELCGRLIRAQDAATYLRADVCRAALDLEIEVTIKTGG